MEINRSEIMKKRDVELLLQGEVQKAVWSLMWSRKKMRSIDIATKTGRRQDSVCRVLEMLVKEGAVKSSGKGVYEVSEDVVR